jgi:putative GTP pyrophosphokinase
MIEDPLILQKRKPVPEDKAYLYEKAINFYRKYAKELNQVKDLLDIRLNQLALAYATENKLPCESISVKTRVKALDSFLKKLDKLDMSDFHFPDKICYDLIGARVTCWFLDDCKGMATYILNSNFLTVEPEEIYDYIERPKQSGYRAIHLHAQIGYDTVSTKNGTVEVMPGKVMCEIQVRTKLMDAWADLTHEFHYKAKDMEVEDTQLEKVLAAQAKRFFSEDESFIAIRDLYQKMITENEKKD